MHVVLGTVVFGILVLFIAPAQAVPGFILRRPSSQVRRLRALLKAKALLHPCCSVNFCHLASALARCCGVHPPELARYSQAERLKVERLADEIGGMSRQHVVRASCRFFPSLGRSCMSHCAVCILTMSSGRSLCCAMGWVLRSSKSILGRTHFLHATTKRSGCGPSSPRQRQLHSPRSPQPPGNALLALIMLITRTFH